MEQELTIVNIINKGGRDQLTRMATFHGSLVNIFLIHGKRTITSHFSTICKKFMKSDHTHECRHYQKTKIRLTQHKYFPTIQKTNSVQFQIFYYLVYFYLRIYLIRLEKVNLYAMQELFLSMSNQMVIIIEHQCCLIRIKKNWEFVLKIPQNRRKRIGAGYNSNMSYKLPMRSYWMILICSSVHWMDSWTTPPIT